MTRARDKANLTQKVTISEPTQLTDGMIWLDTDAVSPSQQSMRWTKTPSGGTTVLSGASDTSITLSYSVGQEQVYANGVLLIRGSDYTASNGTSITLASASVAGDVFEVISIIPLTLVDTYTQAQADGKYVNNTLADAKGDLVVGTADNVISKIAVGSNGQSLVADSTTTTGLRWQGSQAAGKNYFINGSMDIWQRGTSFTTPGGAYTADRFKVTVNGAGTYVVSRQASGLSETQYCLRFQRSAGQTYTHGSFVGYAWETEAMQSLQGKTVTYSFYARVGADWSPLGGMGVQLQQGTGSGTHAFSALTGESAAFAGTASGLTTSWQRFSFTGALSSTATELRTNLSFSPVGTAGANDYIELTGFQLELGSVATPLSRAGGTFAGELAACQRYYWRFGGENVYQFFGSGLGSSSTNVYFFINNPTTMRTAPTSLEFSTLACYDGPNAVTVTNLVLDRPTKNGVFLSATGSGLTQYRPYLLTTNNSASGYLACSAEL